MTISSFAQHHPWLYFALLVAAMVAVEWASRQFGRPESTP